MTTTPAATGGLTPIETEYAGYKFRSRLEARWALYFDLCKIRWAYESEGFTLSDGQRYLPDFWLPDYNQFVEVKPASDSFKFVSPYGKMAHLTDIDEPGNTTITPDTILFVTIDDKWAPPAKRTMDAILCLQPYTLCTVIVTDEEEGTFPMPLSGWLNPTVMIERKDPQREHLLFKFWVAVQAKTRGDKHCVALADAQDVDVGFRVVFGDPREMLSVHNMTTRELPFNDVAAARARQHRFGGRTA